jgi:hypothetical protein
MLLCGYHCHCCYESWSFHFFLVYRGSYTQRGSNFRKRRLYVHYGFSAAISDWSLVFLLFQTSFGFYFPSGIEKGIEQAFIYSIFSWIAKR